MALFWIILSQEVSVQGFVVGYVFGVAILQSIRLNTRFDREDIPINPAKLPSQLFWLVVYTAILAWDVFVSGVDVARRVIQPKMPINPGQQCISTYDETSTPLISAMSAHSITITPGELVIDFNTDHESCADCDPKKSTMLIHTLDREASNRTRLIADQHRRLELIQRMIGRYE
jgi:multicomponent Na+:H+ antiporter subunit E